MNATNGDSDHSDSDGEKLLVALKTDAELHPNSRNSLNLTAKKV